jgi:glyoxylase-like metal-dependent hydrolase (beta-lactamase superfamily II)
MTKQRDTQRGNVSTTSGSGVLVHTYTAPDDGWVVNTHFIELPTQLIAVDAQYTIPHAKEALAYASTLGKPVTRLYITHYHPDHLLGAAAFGLPIHALAEVTAKIRAVGDRVASEEHEKFPDAIPSRAEKPSLVVTPGTETIDAVRFEFIHLQHAETEHALMIGIPEHRILITQDLIYNRVHVFISERAFETWSAGLEHYKAQPFEKILPGHGAPAGRELYDRMQNYLSTAREVLSKASDGDDLKGRLSAAFPDYAGRSLLDHQKRFLFPPRKEAKA